MLGQCSDDSLHLTRIAWRTRHCCWSDLVFFAKSLRRLRAATLPTWRNMLRTDQAWITVSVKDNTQRHCHCTAAFGPSMLTWNRSKLKGGTQLTGWPYGCHVLSTPSSWDFDWHPCVIPSFVPSDQKLPPLLPGSMSVCIQDGARSGDADTPRQRTKYIVLEIK